MTPKILVIDDDNALREMVGIVLSSAGFTPEYCPDGNQALETFKAFNPDLVLLDVMLPEKTASPFAKKSETFRELQSSCLPQKLKLKMSSWGWKQEQTTT